MLVNSNFTQSEYTLSRFQDLTLRQKQKLVDLHKVCLPDSLGSVLNRSHLLECYEQLNRLDTIKSYVLLKDNEVLASFTIVKKFNLSQIISPRNLYFLTRGFLVGNKSHIIQKVFDKLLLELHKLFGLVKGIYIETFFVSPHFQRIGLGKILMRELELTLDSMGFTEISLDVSRDNGNAISFYIAWGFVKKGKTFNSYIMTKKL
jgi:ribosomal protein S18 acetylase RimI-like enzyme